MDLNGWLQRTRLVVCVGSGGVGKTTTAASIGLWGALQGRKVMVLTIDPAKRLANSLGLDAIGGEGVRIDLSGLPRASGELWAMMLDSRSTFDDIIRRVAPTPEIRDRLLANVTYRYLADTFAGSQDYMATEKLYDLVNSGRYDMVVLDTPPVKNALDFLESPGRVVSFLDERVIGMFVGTYDKQRVFGRRLVLGTSAVVWRLLSFIVGQEFLDDFTAFLEDFQTVYEGFRRRHDAVMDLLRAPDTAFVTVCAPTESSVDVACYFQEELVARSLPSAGVVVNQVHRCIGETHDAFSILGEVLDGLDGELDPRSRATVLARLGMAHRRLSRIAQAERALIERVEKAALGGGFLQEVRRLDGEVHDLPALHTVGQELFEQHALYLGEAPALERANPGPPSEESFQVAHEVLDLGAEEEE